MQSHTRPGGICHAKGDTLVVTPFEVAGRRAIPRVLPGMLLVDGSDSGYPFSVRSGYAAWCMMERCTSCEAHALVIDPFELHEGESKPLV